MSDHAPIYIYESPDRGNTLYRRRRGSNQRESVSEGPLREKMLRSQLWRDIFLAAETDPELQHMIEQVEIYHALKNTTLGP
jgi:hypothetical protein